MPGLFGQYVENPAAFCKLHHSYLRVKDIKKRKCLEKQCYHLSRIDDHGFWEQRRLKQELRKERKERHKRL